ncbi:hypothetical protein [Aliivibrio fischeri]|uniref:Uncharacterized protein n=1 Tax=Aliivibrio fischeri TaxID=668 RepID=A0A844P641_ALIFS|nr:hypothetical protein [Aliivibrio fischeri]MUK50768.1 hypothetical protein [Aliivibrio fischeri]
MSKTVLKVAHEEMMPKINQDFNTIELVFTDPEVVNEVNLRTWKAQELRLRKSLPIIFDVLEEASLPLREKGFLSLLDSDYWMLVEEALITSVCKGYKLIGTFERAVRILSSNPAINSPSMLCFGTYRIPLYRYYTISSGIISEFKSIVKYCLVNDIFEPRYLKTQSGLLITAIMQLSEQEGMHDYLFEHHLSGLTQLEGLKECFKSLNSRHSTASISWVVRIINEMKNPNPHVVNSIIYQIYWRSPKLADDLLKIQTVTELGYIDWFPCNKRAFISSLKPFKDCIDQVIDCLGDDSDRFVELGLDYFDNDLSIAKVESIIINSESIPDKSTYSMLWMLRYRFQNREISSPIKKDVGELTTFLWGLYRISPEFALESRSVIGNIAIEHESLSARRNILTRISTVIAKISIHEYQKSILVEHGLNGIVKNIQLFSKKYLVNFTESDFQHLGILVRELDPEKFGSNNFKKKARSESYTILVKNGWNIDIGGGE